MNVFEALIEELKQEYLIEGEVIESNQSDTMSQETTPADDAPRAAELPIQDAVKSAESALFDNLSDASPPISENEFYRRRAMEEVSSLQLVERILSGVEREQMKIVPKPFDDIAVSKALHDFLQISKNSHSPDNAAAEFRLMQETETWYSALSYRDKNILPAHLRRYCETTRPVLSSQALAALARFYRNSPFSELVRSKFEMVVTRLFSQEKDNDERKLVFGYNEIIQHLSELYADWSSVSLYATDDDSKLSAIMQGFEDFINEADSASEFEELVASNFFNRLRAFKESAGENFYAPAVVATVIECNIRVGNIYVELLKRERQKNNAASLENKFGYLLDQTVSEAASKTLQLTNLLEGKNLRPVEEDISENVKPAEEVKKIPEKTQKVKTEAGNSQNSLIGKFSQVNKWLLGATILTIILSFGLYSWVEVTEPQASSEGVRSFQMEGYYFKDYLKSAKIVDENLIGLVSPSWGDISEEKKQEVLKNMLTVGREKDFKTVRLQDREGKTIGYAAENNITVSNSNSGSNSNSK